MRKWWKYIKPYWGYFLLGPICMIVEVIGEVLMPAFLSCIVDNLTVGEEAKMSTPGSITQLITDLISSLGGNISPNDTNYIIWLAVFMVITAVLMMAGGVGGSYFGAKASVSFATDVRKDLYKKIQGFSFSNIDRFSTSSLVTRLTNDVTQVQNFINMLLRMCLRAPGMMIGAVIMAIRLNGDLAVVLAVSIPVLIISQSIIIAIGYPRFKNMQTRIDGLNSTVQESITNVRVIKAYVREDHENSKFKKANGNLKKAGMAAMHVMITMGPIMTVIMNVTTLAVVYLGSSFVLGGNMSVGNLTAFITYINQILMSLMILTFVFMASSRAIASGKRISEVLEEKQDISDEDAKYKDLTVKEGKIEFRNVSFKYYKTSTEKVLDNINLTINPRETVGIIGSTGCGKTTLVSMITRLYDPDSGEVLIDDVNVKDYSLFNLRENIATVLQKNVLFSGSIEDNLRWGDPDADLDTIRYKASLAQADTFVSSFTKGYDTNLGQGGVNVSGGQKQRLCIARALLKNPKIIILDDSTSAVDTATEAKIQNALQTDLKDTTKIIIAQRISSVINADKIIVMNDGKITGIGRHADLIETNQDYQEIYYSQVDKEEEHA